MSPYVLVVLLCPALVLSSGISVHLKASAEAEQNAVDVAGNDIEIISDAERKTFQLNDNQLKNAISKFFGKRPDDAYLHSPTPWGDLYEKHGWEQVTRTMVPQNAKVLGLHTEPVIVMTQYFHNNSTVEATFEVHISQSVTDSVQNTWSSSHEFTVGQEIKYEFNILAVKGGGSTTFQYKGQFGKSDTYSHSVTVGSETGTSVTLKPGQSAVAKLTATRGSMKAQVEYDASLQGYTACNYEETYNGHHFWALWLPAVMDSAGISNSLKSSQLLSVGFYSDSKVVVEDVNTREIILETSGKIF